jgi:putative Ca2+/H+ antiporter (TMEM165/GDT1 family)
LDWKLCVSTFAVIFLAELGDKTQLATFGLATGERSRVAVFLGAAGALVVTSAIAVLLGDAVTRAVPEVWLRRAAAALFIALGVWYLLGEG